MRSPDAGYALATVAMLLGAALALGACAPLLGVRRLSTARPGTTTFHAVQVDGRTRHFLLHLPPGAAQRPVPLVLAFHGHGGNGAVLRASSRLDEAADALGFAVAYPDGTGPLGWVGLSWNVGTCCGRAKARRVDDLAFVDTLVATLRRLPAVDSTRIFAVGFSAGGMLALRLACERAAIFTAIADVAGAMPDMPCAPSRPVSVLLLQGAADEELRFDLRTLVHLHGHAFARSLEQTFRFWAGRAGCTADAVARDSTPASVDERAVGCANGRAVELVTIARHPHAWPGGVALWWFAPRPAPHVDASHSVLEFFRDSDGRRRHHSVLSPGQNSPSGPG